MDCCSHDQVLLAYHEVLKQLHDYPIRQRTTVQQALTECRGLVLAEPVTSPIDVPGYDNSAMDGYALRYQDTLSGDALLPISQRIAAGETGKPLQPGTAARIFTGAPIPEGADAVVMQEECEVIEQQIRLNRAVSQGENIRPRGNDIGAGHVVMQAGICIEPQHMGLLASLGLARLPVYSRPRVSILCTGDELVEPGQALAAGQIYNSNRYLLRGMLEKLNCEIIDHGVLADDYAQTEAALTEAAAGSDLIVTTGGVSVGEEDHVKNAMQRQGQLDLWRIAIKPGKPLAFGSINNTPFFGLPGNPVSTLVTFLLFCRPFVNRLRGMSQVREISFDIAAGFDWTRQKKRREFVRVRIETGEHGKQQAVLYPKQGSDVLSSVVWADGLVEIPENSTLQAGDMVRFYPFSEIL